MKKLTVLLMEGVAQDIRALAYKCEALSSKPSATKRKKKRN
jgi:hypothetical protein